MDFVVGGLAGVVAGFFWNPFDVAKTRIQLQGELRAKGNHAVHYMGVTDTIFTIMEHDGISALYRGLVPALWIQLVVNSIRLGIYQEADDYGFLRNKEDKTELSKSIFVAALSGMAGAFCGSPLQLVKTQLMSYSSETIAVGTQHAHEGMVYAMTKIYRKNGLRGLWRGAHGNMLRSSITNSSQVTSYAMCKDWLKANNICQQSRYLSAFVAGNVAAVVKIIAVTPMDVIMIRLYNQAVDEKGRGVLYSGITDCARKIFQTEGLLALYKGVWCSYQAPHTILLLVIWDMLKDYHKSNKAKATV